MSPVLRINTVLFGPASEGQRRITVTWQDGPIPWQAITSFSYVIGEQDAEKIRWYLEDYAEYPSDPAPRIALDTEHQLARIGADLFRRVFSGQDAAGIWAQARNRLGQVRVEIDNDPADAPGLPWELLRDPGAGINTALEAGGFVRTHLQAAVHPTMPEPTGDRLRVLLVICRPGGREDVPFRSVASRLVRGGVGKMTGMDLDVLRPATFTRLSKVLRDAAAAGRPYHVVHFDGHGTFVDLADLLSRDQVGDDMNSPDRGAGGGLPLSPLYYGFSVAGAVRKGQHGYLLFEDPARPDNQQLVDGPTLGSLLTAAQVPVLVLNACRSAYTEAPEEPVADGPQLDNESASGAGTGSDGALAELTMDVHGRIRAYGSLAAEIVDAGVPGVVAMRYNVYVVTAAQFAADMYAHLLAGSSLGQAATAARRVLADDPARQIGAVPVALQDWAVPVVYEAAPLTLLKAETRQAPSIHLSVSDRSDTVGASGGPPRPPDAGFLGRDETLLALDRTFDTQQVILLQAFAGAGKSSTAAEFARWYQATGGLDHPTRPEWGPGVVLWSSFEHHLPLDQLIGTAGDHFAELLETNGIQWQALTDPGLRHDLLLQVLAQVPTLWVWDNTEPVTGFPPGTPSAWTNAEQSELADFLRDLDQQTSCKVLLTSRRDEQAWLAGLPTRLQLPPMPMRERLQLAGAIVGGHGPHLSEVDWRPLLRFSGGNPLAITVLMGQVLRENLTTTAQIQELVARLRAGEAALEPGEDAALGRTRSLAASLSYGFTNAFTESERAQLAVLHLFRDTIDADALRYMGEPENAGSDAVPQLAGLTRDTAITLLDRAADIGLLTSIGSGYYTIHPALPWYFTAIYIASYGQPSDPQAQHATRAYAHIFATLSRLYHNQHVTGAGDPIPALQIEEANLQHALTLSRQVQRWDDVEGCMQGLYILFQDTGRNAEWAWLIADITPDYVDPDTDGPLSGREEGWDFINQYRVELAMNMHDWPTATRLQRAAIARYRNLAAAALATPDGQLTSEQRLELRNLAVTLETVGHILRFQNDSDCLAYYQEAVGLFQRAGARSEEANMALTLGNTYIEIQELRDLDQAERWYRRSFELRTDRDRLGQARSLGALGSVPYQRFQDALGSGESESVLLEYLNESLARFKHALDLMPSDDAQNVASIHNMLGNIYSHLDRRLAVQHYQQYIRYGEAQGDISGTGTGRHNIALLFAREGRIEDALQYARAALHDYQRLGPGAAQHVTRTQKLIGNLEEDMRGRI
jgi:tetratricopeptide (TPR) repeat protein